MADNGLATINGTPRILDQYGRPIPPAQPGVANVYTFSGLYNSATKAYSHRYDEADKKGHENALSMTRDCYLMGLLRERQYPVSQMSWHIEPENKKDGAQVEEAAYLTTLAQAVPNIEEMFMQCLWAEWYGRAGVQTVMDFGEVNGQQAFYPHAYFPVNGDKIQFSWDGTPRVYIWGGLLGGTVDMSDANLLWDYQGQKGLNRDEVKKEAGPQARIVWTELNPALELKDPFWRDRFIIHKHDCIDADFFHAEEAGGIHGVGIRHWLAWNNWLKMEILSWIMDFMERTGLGLTIYFYEQGNPASLAAAQAASKTDGRNTVLVWPRSTQGANVGSGIERIETSTSGANFLIEVVEGYFDAKAERFVVGQSMSGGGGGKGGLEGDGRAQFAKETKAYILRSDANRLAGSLTTDFVRVLQKYNRPQSKFRHAFKFDIDKPDPESRLNAAKILWDMGATLKEDEVMALAGFSRPNVDDKILQNPQFAQAPGGGGGVTGETGQPLPGIPGLPGVHGQVPIKLPWMDARTPMPGQQGAGGNGAGRLPWMDGSTPTPGAPSWLDARAPSANDREDYEARHAPAGGIDIAGQHFEGGEFIPGGVYAKASAKEKAALDTKPGVHPGSAHGSSVRVKPTKTRAFDGTTPVQTKTTLTKQETGRVGEAVILAYLKDVRGRKDARPMNASMTNFPIDLIEGHAPTEVKAGLVSNGSDAQKWRLTFSKESAAEKAAYDKMSETKRTAWNEEKQQRIKDRKLKAVAELEKKTGKKVKPRTMTVVINPDTKTADIYEFQGWHDIIRWRSDEAKQAYKGSVVYA